jgi:hypothetical protein
MPVRTPCGRCADRVAYLLGNKTRTLPGLMRGNLTWHQGEETARHAELTAATGLDVFFRDPRPPRRRGTNEPPASGRCPHGRSAPAALPQGHRPARAFPGRPRPGHGEVGRTTPEDPGPGPADRGVQRPDAQRGAGVTG